MSQKNKTIGVSITAAENLNTEVAGTGHIYKAIANNDGKIANTGAEATGILCFGGLSGKSVTITTFGFEKFTAGEAITKGDKLTVTTSGYFVVADRGTSEVGQAMYSCASGSVNEGFFNFSSPNISDSNLTFATQTDLSAASNLGLAIDTATGNVAATGDLTDGVLQTTVASGQTAEYRVMGTMMVAAGDVVTVNRSLKVTTGGYFINADSGDLIVGRALQASAAGNSGSTFNAAINFSTPHYATSSLDVQY